MAQEFNEKYLVKERDELNDVIKELDDLYLETKGILDNHIQRKDLNDNISLNNKNYTNKVNYIFISSQTSNLISIKEKKLNLIKEKVRIATEIEHLKNKLEQNQTDEDRNQEVLKQLIANISSNSSIINNEIKIGSNEINNLNTDDELDNMIDDILIEDKLEEIKEEDNHKLLLESLEEKGLNIVVNNLNLRPYVVDDNYAIYNEYDDAVLDMKFFRKENDKDYVEDENGNEFELVEIEF